MQTDAPTHRPTRFRIPALVFPALTLACVTVLVGTFFVASAGGQATVLQPAFGQTAVVQPASHMVSMPERVKMRMYAERTHFVAGETNWLALVLDIENGWHIYWRNPGGGMTTSWSLKDDIEGVTLGDAQWQLPERYELPKIGMPPKSPGVDYVYHKRAMILIPVEVASSLAEQESLTVSLNVDWLVCKESCIPGSGTIDITLPLTGDPSVATEARAKRLFDRARSEQPEVLEDEDALVRAGIEASWEEKTLVIALAGASEMTFLPYENDERIGVKNPNESTKARADHLKMTFDADPSALKAISGVLIVEKDGEEHRFEIHVPTE